MINGAHVNIHCHDADADAAFIRDVAGSGVGGGCTPAEVALDLR